MRPTTPKGYWRELRKRDPNCPLGLPAIYELVRSGAVPTRKVGRRTLFDADTMDKVIFAGSRDDAS